MSNQVHEVQAYEDRDNKWRWRIVALPVEEVPDIIAVSSEGYANKSDMIQSFFAVFFGEYNDSFLSMYNEWDPEHNKVGS